MNTTTSQIQTRIPSQTYSYSDYMRLMEQVVREGRTTGPKQSESLNHYTKLNLHRMQRLNKTVVLTPDFIQALQEIKIPQTWYVLTEAWCGDAAQALPIFATAALNNPLIDLRLLLRDENPGLMDLYLTNGARSIPKLIALDQDFNELFQWGPRPAGAQLLLMAYKQNPSASYELFSEQIQRWYNLDKTLSIQKEILDLLKG
jgi:hypothetical protein